MSWNKLLIIVFFCDYVIIFIASMFIASMLEYNLVIKFETAWSATVIISALFPLVFGGILSSLKTKPSSLILVYFGMGFPLIAGFWAVQIYGSLLLGYWKIGLALIIISINVGMPTLCYLLNRNKPNQERISVLEQEVLDV